MVSEGSLLRRQAEDSLSHLITATEHAHGGPRCDLCSPVSRGGPGNLSWCSSCQPWCFAAAACHCGGWDLLKGNHVNLYVTTQSKAERWCWQAWWSQQKVSKAKVVAFPQRCRVGIVFFLQLYLYFCFPFLLTGKSSWHGLRRTELAFRAGHLE